MENIDKNKDNTVDFEEFVTGVYTYVLNSASRYILVYMSVYLGICRNVLYVFKCICVYLYIYIYMYIEEDIHLFTTLDMHMTIYLNVIL
jgi:hypothetical protein